jgi:hypothetical protein
MQFYTKKGKVNMIIGKKQNKYKKFVQQVVVQHEAVTYDTNVLAETWVCSCTTGEVARHPSVPIQVKFKKKIYIIADLPWFCLVVGPPMCSVKNKYVSSSPFWCTFINCVYSQSLYPLHTNSCFTFMYQEMGHIVLNTTIIVLQKW